MASWTFYVDPVIGAPVVEGTTLKTCSGPLGMLVHALFTVRGSVDGLEDFGGGLWDQETMPESSLPAVEALIDQALGSIEGEWDSYARRVVLNENGMPVAEITLTCGPNVYTEQFLLQR